VPFETGSQAQSNRISANHEHDWNRRRRLFRDQRGACTPHSYKHRPANQIGCELRQAIQLAFGETIFGGEILALGKTGLFQSLFEGGDVPHGIPGRPGTEKSDHRHRRLLRARGKRPEKTGSRRRAQACDEFTPFHFDSRYARSENTKKIENYL